VCITTNQPDTKLSNPNPIPNPNPTTKQHAIVNIQLHMRGGQKNWHTFVRLNLIRLNFIKY